MSGVTEPFQSPRISYAAEDCAVCHAAGTTHHHYSEWSQYNPDTNRSHSKLSIAQSEGLTSAKLVDGGPGYELNSSCGRCHASQGYTEYVANLQQGNVGALSIAQQQGVVLADGGVASNGLLTYNNVQAQTCQTCHDPHADTFSASGEDTYQLRVYDNTGLLPGGFAGVGLGAGAVCETCHNSRNGAYLLADAGTNTFTTVAYLHEDNDPIGSNPANPNLGGTYAALGTNFSSIGSPHEANQSDVFEGHNAYFLNNQTPVLTAHSAVKDTCVGCHMTNNPGPTYNSHGTPTVPTHMFYISDAEAPTLCAKCHGDGLASNVDGASLAATVAAGLNSVQTSLQSAIVNRLNDIGKTAPVGYGWWTDTGVINIAAGNITDTTGGVPITPGSLTAPSCGTAVSATYPSCSLKSNAALILCTTAATCPTGGLVVGSWTASVVTLGRSVGVTLSFANGIPIVFKNGSTTVTNTVQSFNVPSLGSLLDNTSGTSAIGSGTVYVASKAGPYPIFGANGNVYKVNWNYELIAQDASNGVHNPGFVSSVLSATAESIRQPERDASSARRSLVLAALQS